MFLVSVKNDYVAFLLNNLCSYKDSIPSLPNVKHDDGVLSEVRRPEGVPDIVFVRNLLQLPVVCRLGDQRFQVLR